MMITVSFFNRKRIPGVFSIETLFETVWRHLPSDIQPRIYYAPHENIAGKRISNMGWTFKNRGAINHVTGDISYIALALPSRRTILTVHDCAMVAREKNQLKRMVALWLWWILPVWWSRVVTVISEKTKDELRQLTRCPEKKIVVIPDCLSPEFSQHSRPFHQEQPRVLQIGFTKNKNIPRLIQSLEGISCHFRMIGIPDDETLNALKTTGIPHSFAHNLTIDEMVDEYIQADIVAFVSTYEGFGLPIIEAQAVGRPVITSNLPPMCHVAGTGACLVDPWDVHSIREGILRIISDESYRQTLVENGMKNVKNYTPEAIALQYAEVYRHIAKSSRS